MTRSHLVHIKSIQKVVEVIQPVYVGLRKMCLFRVRNHAKWYASSIHVHVDFPLAPSASLSFWGRKLKGDGMASLESGTKAFSFEWQLRRRPFVHHKHALINKLTKEILFFNELARILRSQEFPIYLPSKHQQ